VSMNDLEYELNEMLKKYGIKQILCALAFLVNDEKESKS
jgi:hypothetical protein